MIWDFKLTRNSRSALDIEFKVGFRPNNSTTVAFIPPPVL